MKYRFHISLEIDMKRLLLLVVMVSTLTLSSALKFDLDGELFDMYVHTDSYPQYRVHRMCKITLAWLQNIIEKHSKKKIKLNHRDRMYLGRVSYMLAHLCNKSGYCYGY